MINGRETVLNKKTSGRETGFVKPATELAQKTNEVAAGIKQIFAE